MEVRRNVRVADWRVKQNPPEIPIRAAATGARGLCGAWICAAALILAGCAAELHSSVEQLPADGISGGRVVYRPAWFDLRASRLKLSGDLTAIEILDRRPVAGGEELRFKSAGSPGRVVFQAPEGLELAIRFYVSAADSDGDGFPDSSELISAEDRAAFVGWFVRIAEAQYIRPSRAWHEREQDCAGLIRFAYREALKRHDAAWQERTGVLIDKNLPDPARFVYPRIPYLGERIFRLRAPAGAFAPEHFGPFADAATLMQFNARLISRDADQAEPGDLLFFRSDWNLSFPYHSMIVATRDETGVRVIYHTGGSAGLKRAPLSYLTDGPDPRWRPLASNPHFLGVFRLHLIE